MADAVIDAHTRQGTLATIYANRVSALAALCGVGAGALLGRATAHEIAHLLLGTRTYSPSGLMRAHWPAAAIRDSQEHAWRLSAGEARALRTALTARGAQQLVRH